MTSIAGLLGCLASAAPAAAAPSFTWIGASAAPSWSAPANWTGTAPSGSVGELTFPALTSAACTATPPTATCLASTNDVTGLTATGLSIDDGAGYQITGNAISIGPAGLTAAPSARDPATPNDEFSTLNVPIVLTAPQTWSIAGGSPNQQLLVLGSVTGPKEDPLGITLSANAGLTLASAAVGPVTILGDGNASDGFVDLGSLDSTGTPVLGSLNASNGQPVSVTAAGGLLAIDGAIGPLTVADGLIQIGEAVHAGLLAVDGSVQLNAQSGLVAFISQPGASPGTDYSELTATGTVDLGDAQLALATGDIPGTNVCEPLTVGDVATIIDAPAGLIGQFDGIPDGTVLPAPLNCLGSGGPGPTVRINYDYEAGTVTATVVTAGTPGTPTTTTLTADPSDGLVTDQPVMLTATVTPPTATPAGTVAFTTSAGTPLPGCAVVPISLSESSYAATCQASFAAWPVTTVDATFTPSNGSPLAGSTTSLTLNVAPQPTSTSVTASATTVAADHETRLTTTTTRLGAGPTELSGAVDFLANGAPISGCTGILVAEGKSTATAQCDAQFNSATGTSTEAITANYDSDQNFGSSSSAPLRLTIVGPPAGGQPTRPPEGIGRAGIGHVGATATAADIVVTCKGAKGQRCTVRLKLSTREKTKAGKLLSAVATKTTQRTVVLGLRTVTLAAGLGEVVHVKLNAVGRRALALLRKLPVTLTATQKTSTGTGRPTLRAFTFKALAK